MRSGTAARIAIVGSGPRALWALERLDSHLVRPGATTPAAVHVFGPGALGAGAVYAEDQPDYLRLNASASIVDAWAGRRSQGPSFNAWREQREPGSSSEEFPSRALTGAYLAEQAERLLCVLRSRLGTGAVAVHSRVVGTVERAADGAGWMLDGEGPYDEVLLAVGHATGWPGALSATWPADAPPLQPSVFPLADLQARPELRAGARVLVRGAALTAIDALLALTLGRGQEPGTPDLQVVLASRTGRPMMPKTPADVLHPLIERAGDLGDLRARIAAGADVPAQLRLLAARLLGDGPLAQEEVACAESRLGGDGSDDDPVAVLRRSVEVASGVRRPDGAWALGQAWRLLYRDLVERQRRTPASRPPLDWPGFSTCAPELERLAFGPPLVNARHLLDALTGGHVTMVRGGLQAGGRRHVDLVVDAVLAPPGIVDLADDHVLGRLRDQGVLSHGVERRGARVAADATVIDTDGNPVRGLAMIGRATEDEVLGNDTLDRTMHPHVDRWARRVASAEATAP